MSSNDDLRNSALQGQWSLEKDGKLLEIMQKLGSNIESRSTSSKAKMDQLLLRLDETKISLSNVTSKLLALQNQQFVENRVYEDDETIANISEVPKNDESNTQNNVVISSQNAAKISLENGLKMMENCFEKVFVDVGCDSNETMTKNVVYRPIDPYDSSLPYLIGTEKWKKKWHLGLVKEPTDTVAVSISNPEKLSNSPHSNVTPSSSMPSRSASASENSLYLHPDNKSLKSQEDQKSFQESPLPSAKIYPEPRLPLFPSEEPPADTSNSVNTKSKGIFEETDEEADNVSISTPKPQKVPQQSLGFFIGNKNQSQQNYGNLFNDQPPLLEEPVSITPKKSTNLFEDSEEDDFQPQMSQKPKKVSLFDNQPPPIDENEVGLPKPAKKPARGLFEESEEEMDFPPKVTKERIEEVKVVNKKPSIIPGNLIKDLEKTLAGKKAVTSTDVPDNRGIAHKAPEISGDSKVNQHKEVTNALNKPVKSKNDSEKQQKSSRTPKIQEKQVSPEKVVPKAKKPITNLFDDDEDNDIFGSSKTEKPAENPQKSITVKKYVTDLFDDVEVKKPDTKKPIKNLFEDEEDDDSDDLFGKPSLSVSKPAPPSAPQKSQKPKVPVIDLFNDSEFENFIAKIEKTQPKKEETPPPAVVKTVAHNPKPESAVVNTKKKIKNLFDDDDDESNYFDQIINSKTKNIVAKDPKVKQKSSGGLFDEDVLISGARNVAGSTLASESNSSVFSSRTTEIINVTNSDKKIQDNTNNKITNSQVKSSALKNSESHSEMGGFFSQFIGGGSSAERNLQETTNKPEDTANVSNLYNNSFSRSKDNIANTAKSDLFAENSIISASNPLLETPPTALSSDISRNSQKPLTDDSFKARLNKLKSQLGDSSDSQSNSDSEVNDSLRNAGKMIQEKKNFLEKDEILNKKGFLKQEVSLKKDKEASLEQGVSLTKDEFLIKDESQKNVDFLEKEEGSLKKDESLQNEEDLKNKGFLNQDNFSKKQTSLETEESSKKSSGLFFEDPLSVSEPNISKDPLSLSDPKTSNINPSISKTLVESSKTTSNFKTERNTQNQVLISKDQGSLVYQSIENSIRKNSEIIASDSNRLKSDTSDLKSRLDKVTCWINTTSENSPISEGKIPDNPENSNISQKLTEKISDLPPKLAERFSSNKSNEKVTDSSRKFTEKFVEKPVEKASEELGKSFDTKKSSIPEKSVPKPNKISDLFGSSPEDFDFLGSIKSSKTQKNREMSGLFGSPPDDDDLFSSFKNSKVSGNNSKENSNLSKNSSVKSLKDPPDFLKSSKTVPSALFIDSSEVPDFLNSKKKSTDLGSSFESSDKKSQEAPNVKEFLEDIDIIGTPPLSKENQEKSSEENSKIKKESSSKLTETPQSIFDTPSGDSSFFKKFKENHPNLFDKSPEDPGSKEPSFLDSSLKSKEKSKETSENSKEDASLFDSTSEFYEKSEEIPTLFGSPPEDDFPSLPKLSPEKLAKFTDDSTLSPLENSSHSNIFDMPPDDDSTPLTSPSQKEYLSSPSSSGIHSALYLSTEPPPIDDWDTDQQHNLDSDFDNNVKMQSNSFDKNPSSYPNIPLFDDLPPDDDYDDLFQANTQAPGKSSIKNRLSKKFGNLNINVNAFKPGAKMPKKRNDTSSAEEAVDPSDNNNGSLKRVYVPSTKVVKDGNNNLDILNNDLNKTRVKGPVKRKPSIKKMRETAVKVDFNENIILDEDEEDKEEVEKIQKTEEPEKELKKDEPKKELKKDEPEKESQKEGPEKQKVTPVLRSNVRPMTTMQNRYTFLGELNSINKMKKTPALDDLTKKEESIPRKEPRGSRSQSMVLPSPDSEENKNFFKNVLKKKDLKEEDESMEENSPEKAPETLTVKTVESSSPKKPSSFEKLLRSAEEKKIKELSNFVKMEQSDSNATNHKNVEVFDTLDDIRDTAAIIESMNPEKMFAETSKASIISDKSAKMLFDNNEKSLFESVQDTKEKSKDSSALFSSDDDDMFNDKKKSSSQSKPKPQAQSQPKSLFGDDDNDDDGIFGSGSKKPKPKTETKENPKSSLFDTDEDDEDLFGGATQSKAPTKVPSTTVNKSKSSSASSSSNLSSTKVIKTTPVTDDPLGGLF